MTNIFKIALLLAVFSLPAYAKDREQSAADYEATIAKINDPEFKEALKNLEALEKDDACDKYWDALWPLAKKGNVNALTQLYYVLMPHMHGDSIFPPGPLDRLAQTRHLIILKIHGSTSELYFGWGNLEKTILRSYAAEQFWQCDEEPSQRQRCIDDAVKDGEIPSLQDYVAEIEAAVAQGKKSICYMSGYDDDFRTETETRRKFR